jgi:hypothetical protein
LQNENVLTVLGGMYNSSAAVQLSDIVFALLLAGICPRRSIFWYPEFFSYNST